MVLWTNSFAPVMALVLASVNDLGGIADSMEDNNLLATARRPVDVENCDFGVLRSLRVSLEESTST